MSDIEHWLKSGAPPEVVDLLDAARAEQPSAQVLEATVVLAATGAAVTGVASGGALHAAKGFGWTAKGGSLGLVKWGVAGLIAGSVAAGGSAWVHHVAPPPEERRVTVPVAKGTPTTRSPAPTVRVERLAVGGTVPPPGSPNVVPVPPPPMAQGMGTASSRAQPDARMTAELSLLERAQASADRGQRALALDLLAEHAREFGPHSALSPEARYLKLEVLAGSGRQAEARAVAREILEHDANAPHATRARRILDEEK